MYRAFCVRSSLFQPVLWQGLAQYLLCHISYLLQKLLAADILLHVWYLSTLGGILFSHAYRVLPLPLSLRVCSI